MSQVTIIDPEIQDLQVSSGEILKNATDLQIVDDSTFELGAGILLEIKKRADMVEDRFAESVSAAHKAHKALTKLRDSVLSPFRTAEATIKRKIGDYSFQVEQLRRIEAEKARKAAESRAEAERIAKATEQMDKGDLKACEETLKTPIAPQPAIPTTPEPPKVKGVSLIEVVKYEVFDPKAVPCAYHMVDEKKISGMVKALGVNANIPGVRIWTEKNVRGSNG